MGSVFRWQKERMQKGINTTGWLLATPRPGPEDFAAAFPAETVDWSALASPPPSGVQAMWVGHATVLAQVGGATFLTDPVFSDRCSPLQCMGPKRVTPPALTATSPELSRLDFVCISHNHYDHLDRLSVLALAKRFPELKWYVPLGLASWFSDHKISNVEELDWWESRHHALPDGSHLEVVFTPAQHWSARALWSKKESLWGGWAVRAFEKEETKSGSSGAPRPSASFWFAGDTGYCPVFKTIGERLGPFDLAAIPTGAYEPRWMMRPQHVDPEEAVQIHRDVRSMRSMAVHLATFCLTDEAMDEPILRLHQALLDAGLDPDEFLTVRRGSVFHVQDGAFAKRPAVLSPEHVAQAAPAAGAAA
ncbi:beta-lactamase [Helicosporidium sp. ATCC 50920]|nr:beta-lactamase [Helicosporidium sp. ATCC 50920]|eukprot:KDD74009.1 beta-lactamase [Helicosporidium sp. ATCC 50920]